LLNIMATIGSCRVERPGMLFPELKTEIVSKAHAVAGASQPRNHAIWGMTLAGVANSRRLSLADGRRGCQERN
jgi:hypothetical protein